MPITSPGFTGFVAGAIAGAAARFVVALGFLYYVSRWGGRWWEGATDMWIAAFASADRAAVAVLVIPEGSVPARPLNVSPYVAEAYVRILWVENHPRFVNAVRQQFLAGHDLTVVPSLEAERAVAFDGPSTRYC